MKKRNIFSIILYVVAGLLAIYAVWAIVSCTGVISEAIKSGQISGGVNLYDIVSYYMSNGAQYFVYALLLAASGVILHRKQPVSEAEIAPIPSAQNMESDREPDDLPADETNADR